MSRPEAPDGEKLRRLFLVVQAEFGKKPDDIRVIVEEGLNYLKKERNFRFGNIKVVPVSSTVYHGMRALIRGETFDPSLGGTGQSVRLVPGGKSTWEVTTGDAFARAKAITLHFENEEDGKIVKSAEPVNYPVASLGEASEPFRFHSPGTYILSLDKDIVPSRYEIELLPDGNAAVKPPIKGEWPREVPYYLLMVDQFEGDQDLLFETLKNNAIVGNGFKDVQTAESATISLATLIDSIDSGLSGWDDEKHYRVRVKKPDGKFPKRVWLYFPVDGDTAKKELARLKAECDKGADSRGNVLAEIRKKAVQGKEAVPLTIGTPPAWYEIPEEDAKRENFMRVFEMGPGSSLTNAQAGPAYGLYVFEFNERIILRVTNSYVQQIEHPRWAEGVQKLSAPGKTP